MKVPPIVSSSLLAVGIDCCSNIIAQRLRAWKNSVPFVFDHVLFLQFALMVMITAPINFCWQAWLEQTFPGWKVLKRRAVESGRSLVKEHATVEMGEKEKDDGEYNGVEEEIRVRNWWNIFRKWFTDCITMGALLNTTMFLVIMGVMKGKSLAQITMDMKTETFKIIFDSYKVWPIANFFSTTYFPVERRIVFLSCCGLIWNIYLSLVAARL